MLFQRKAVSLSEAVLEIVGVGKGNVVGREGRLHDRLEGHLRLVGKDRGYGLAEFASYFIFILLMSYFDKAVDRLLIESIDVGKSVVSRAVTGRFNVSVS